MKALILGATGQVGRALVAGAPAGWQAVALGRDRIDLSRSETIAPAIRDASADLVINAAAYTAVDKAESEPDVAGQVNGVAPGQVAAATREIGSRLIHISTDFVFDGDKSTPYRPGDDTNPLSVYGTTKLAGERAVAKADPAALILRTSWVYAAQGGNFVNTMLRLMREREQVKIVSDQIGTPTSAPSLAKAIWALAQGDSGGVYHFTDAGVASWYDFAVAIEEEARLLKLLSAPVAVLPIATADYPTSARRPGYSVLDSRATWDLTGSLPPHWRSSLRSVLTELNDLG